MVRNRRESACIAAEFDVGGRRGLGLIRNVSRGGLFVRTASVPEVGESVKVRFRRGDDEIHVSGLVWWTTKQEKGTTFARPPGFGVRLLGQQGDLRELFEAH